MAQTKTNSRALGSLALPSHQAGATLKGILIAIFSVLFLVLAFRYRLNEFAINSKKEQVFRGVMLAYFNGMLFLIVPNLAAWLNQQDFMRADNKANQDKLWPEYVFMFIAAFMVLVMCEALISGVMAEVRRTVQVRILMRLLNRRSIGAVYLPDISLHCLVQRFTGKCDY